MDNETYSNTRSHDQPGSTHDRSHAVYGALPPSAPDLPVLRSRALSPPKCDALRKAASQTASSLTIKIARSTGNLSWIPPSRRERLGTYQAELHQSTCLNLNMASGDSAESDLWILPDIDDWELEAENKQQPSNEQSHRAPLLSRAAKSNLERLKARLEGDGWDFIGGKYGEEEKVIREAAYQPEESVDEEFDVVVLPVLKASC